MEQTVTEFETLLREVGAWQTGHFLLSSGLHSDQYIQCQRLLQYPRHGLLFAEALAQRIMLSGLQPDSVVGPALGAVHWELLVALAFDRAILSDKPVRGIFAERPDGTKFEIRRGVELNPGEKVLVVEDVTTTGGSAKQVVELVRSLGAEPVAVGAIIDRSGGKVDFGIPFVSLVELSLESYDPAACPLCKRGEPVTKPGTTKHKN